MASDKADITADDWEIAGVAEIGGAEGPGAGVFFFLLRSKTANVSDQLMLAAAGLGLGGSIGSGAGPGFDGKVSYSSIPCERPFSIRDLDQSLGRISQVSAGFGLGYSVMYASAVNLGGPLFYSADVSGVSVGVGAGGFCFYGMWRSGMLAARSINAEYRASRAQFAR